MGIHLSFFSIVQYLLFACLQSRNSENGSIDKYTIESVFFFFFLIFRSGHKVVLGNNCGDESC